MSGFKVVEIIKLELRLQMISEEEKATEQKLRKVKVIKEELQTCMDSGAGEYLAPSDCSALLDFENELNVKQRLFKEELEKIRAETDLLLMKLAHLDPEGDWGYEH